MDNILDEDIKNLIEHGQVKDLIALPGPAFDRALEIIRRRHAEGQGFRYADEHNPAYCETCEG